MQQFLGKTNFVSIATVWAKLKTDDLVRWKNELWKRMKSWNMAEELTEKVKKELLWWTKLKKEVMRKE